MRLLAAIFSVCAVALADPPALIRMVRNVPNNGSVIQPYVSGRAAGVVLGLRAVSGLRETWLTELHDSFASIEDIDRALIGFQTDSGAADALAYDEVLTASRTMIGLYRPEICYQVMSGRLPAPLFFGRR